MPLVFPFPILVAMGFEAIINVRKEWLVWLDNLWMKRAIGFFIVINIIAAVFVAVKPAHDAMFLYQGISETYHDKKINLYNYGLDIYKNKLSIGMSFYRPRGLKEMRIDNTTELLKKVKQEEDTFLVGYRGVVMPKELQSLEDNCEVFTRTMPTWVLINNFNDWQARSRIWSISKCKF